MTILAFVSVILLAMSLIINCYVLELNNKQTSDIEEYQCQIKRKNDELDYLRSLLDETLCITKEYQSYISQGK
jgi:hypothetical protein